MGRNAVVQVSDRAELVRHPGRKEEARCSYVGALGLVHDDAERCFLERRLAELDGVTAPERSGPVYQLGDERTDEVHPLQLVPDP
jgi:hypothetical protein